MALTDFFSFSAFQKAGKLERPPPDFLDDGWYNTSAGQIDKDTALKYSAVFRAVKLISTSVGKLPLFVYKKTDDGKDKAPESPAYNLLRYKPNGEMTAKIFKQTLTGHAVLQGSGYAYIVRDGAGRPQELIPMDPENTYPIREKGILFYVTTVDNEQIKMFASEVLHIRGLGYSGITSYSLLEYADISFNMGLNSQKYSNKFFENSARPAVILEHPQIFNDEKAIKRLRDSWNKMYQGVDNSHGTAVLEQGMKANMLSLSAKDSQLIETMKFSVVDVANWFGLPPHKLGDNSRTAYNSLEQENQAFLDEALDDWLVTWEEECRDKLLTEKEKDADSHIVEFTRQALVRADLKARAEYYTKALSGAPWLTINKVRDLESVNSAGPEYDEIILPSNNFASEEESDSEQIESSRSALEHIKEKMLTRIKKDFDNCAKRGEVQIFMDGFNDKHGVIIRKELEPPAKVYELLTGETGTVEKIITELMRIVKG